MPYVVEPAAGVDRGCLALLCEAYDEETQENGETRTVLRLKPALAPIKVAVLPLKRNKPEIVGRREAIKNTLQATGEMRAVYDDTGGIGKAYSRQTRSAPRSASRWTSTPWARAGTATRLATPSPCATATPWNRSACPSPNSPTTSAPISEHDR